MRWIIALFIAFANLVPLANASEFKGFRYLDLDPEVSGISILTGQRLDSDGWCEIRTQELSPEDIRIGAYEEYAEEEIWVIVPDSLFPITLETFEATTLCFEYNAPHDAGGPLGAALDFLWYAASMQRFLVLEKQVGETPLQCVEAYRAQYPHLADVPLAYAGRLDPMASGKLLVLVGDECKNQTAYHKLDKEYEFEVLFGVGSDTGDVLGIVEGASSPRAALGLEEVRIAVRKLTGKVSLPYPAYSSKTVQGKPLHTWTLEGRLHEIAIPTYDATIYKLTCSELYEVPATKLFKDVAAKIELLPTVTEASKAIGNDFRRPEVRAAWAKLKASHSGSNFQIARFTCIGSSGLYMRTLASEIAKQLNTTGLAYSIHRTKIGRYHPLFKNFGFWRRQY